VRRLLLIPLLLVGALVGGAQSRAHTNAVSQTLHAQVGPDFQIGLSFDDGTPVTNLPAGTYTVQVKDLSDQHNFHLYGPGVDQKTEIGTASEATWTVTFQDQNAYSFQCDAHASLTGNFTVGNLAAPPPVTTHAPDTTPAPEPAPAPLPVRGTLKAQLSAKTVVLAKSGKKVKKLPRGIYTFAVKDASTKDGLTLRQVVGGSTESVFTSPKFVGSKTASVELRPGKWKVYSTTRETSVYAFFDVS
jgi:hypothetical protein